MKKKILHFLSWFLGIGALVGGISTLLSGESLEALYYFGFSAILLPPINNLILKSKLSKLIKLSVFLILIVGMVFGFYSGEASRNKSDALKESNVRLLRWAASKFCEERGKCATSFNELKTNGYLSRIPLESFNQEEYFYEVLDNGKDCLIWAKLGSKLKSAKYAQSTCSGNIESLKYFRR